MSEDREQGEDRTANTGPAVGTVGWVDLTVGDAEGVRDFYRAVVGWRAEGEDMGGYEDFNMLTPAGDCVAGICHARGANAAVPAQWMIYLVVADLDASLAEVAARGGEVVVEPRTMGAARYCVIQDPAGAVAALYQAG